MEDYASRDSIIARRCDCRRSQAKERYDTQQTPFTLLASAAVLALVGLSVAACGAVGAATASPSQVTL